MMDWLYCNDCHAVFMAEDASIRREEERHYWLDDSPVEVLYMRCCPECGSSDIDEAAYCDECGCAFAPDGLDDNFLCEECREKYEGEN